MTSRFPAQSALPPGVGQTPEWPFTPITGEGLDPNQEYTFEELAGLAEPKNVQPTDKGVRHAD